MALFGALDAATSGLTVSRVWLDAISDNVSNINTIRSTKDQPFRARMVIVSAIHRGEGEAGGAQVDAIKDRPGEANIVYDPTHPLADENGNVQNANVDLSVEMTNMIIANRSYQANLRMVEIATDTYRSALQIGKR